MSSKNNPTISEQLAKLGELVAWFESDEFQLEAAIEKFAEAEKLAAHIEQELGEFKNKVNLIKKDFSEE